MGAQSFVNSLSRVLALVWMFVNWCGVPSYGGKNYPCRDGTAAKIMLQDILCVFIEFRDVRCPVAVADREGGYILITTDQELLSPDSPTRNGEVSPDGPAPKMGENR